MPAFALSIQTHAPVEDVWKLLHDPSRFPDWWAGIETVEPGSDGRYTMWPLGYPDYPMAQHMSAEPGRGVVTISCLVSDLEFRWQLAESAGGTTISVNVELPEQEAERLDQQHALISQSLHNLADLAAASS